MKEDNKAVILLSGGLDSTTCLSIAVKDNSSIYALSFDYGQRHKKELDCAKKVACYYNIEAHRIINLELFAGNALTDGNIAIPDYSSGNTIPSTYVPARNILFLSYALSYAETIVANRIYIGISSVDYSGYPDCRPDFVEAFQKVIDVGTKSGTEGDSIKILTPLLFMSKAETIKTAKASNAPLHLTTSCYHGKEKACGLCDSCVLRLKGFKEAGFIDTIEYE